MCDGAYLKASILNACAVCTWRRRVGLTPLPFLPSVHADVLRAGAFRAHATPQRLIIACSLAMTLFANAHRSGSESATTSSLTVRGWVLQTRATQCPAKTAAAASSMATAGEPAHPTNLPRCVFTWHVSMPLLILVQDLDHGHANCCNRHLSGYRTRIIGCCSHTAHQGCSLAGVPRATLVLAVSRRRHQRPAQHRRRHTIRRHQSRQHQTRRPPVRQQLARRIPS